MLRAACLAPASGFFSSCSRVQLLLLVLPLLHSSRAAPIRGLRLMRLTGHTHDVRKSSFHPTNPALVLSCGDDNTTRVWDRHANVTLQQIFLTGSGGAALDCAFNPSNPSEFAVATMNSIVLVFNLSGSFVTLQGGHTGKVHSVSYNQRNSSELVSFGLDARLVLWSTQAPGQPVHTLNTGAATPTGAVDPFTGEFILSGAGNGNVILWNKTNRSVIRTLVGHTNSVYGVAFNPWNRSEVLSGGNDGTVRLWNVETGALIRTFSGHTDQVRSVAFSPHNSDLIVSGSVDDYAYVWCKSNGSVLVNLSGHAQGVLSATFNPHNASEVITTSLDNTVQLWYIGSNLTSPPAAPPPPPMPQAAPPPVAPTPGSSKLVLPLAVTSGAVAAAVGCGACWAKFGTRACTSVTGALVQQQSTHIVQQAEEKAHTGRHWEEGPLPEDEEGTGTEVAVDAEELLEAEEEFADLSGLSEVATGTA
eukprot:TRINITY_DN16120_c0_g1_i1.p1 TRINITY_DN16120_c0_g1~~TRINITY_DN16120_c0_g1_i1.p1  ORF type:complete len:485 (+),score=65.47 TRINITY_DN16120_c0_g1_i1:32-1456(+)